MATSSFPRGQELLGACCLTPSITRLSTEATKDKMPEGDVDLPHAISYVFSFEQEFLQDTALNSCQHPTGTSLQRNGRGANQNWQSRSPSEPGSLGHWRDVAQWKR